jgi:hypothetical protein
MVPFNRAEILLGLYWYTGLGEGARYSAAPEGGLVVSMDGVVKMHWSGKLARKQPDSTKLLKQPDSTKLVKQPDSTKLLKQPDCTKLVKQPDSTKLVKQPDRTKLLKHPQKV